MTALPPRTAVRLSAFYAAVFTVIGVHMPFWPVWLEARGLNAAEIGVLLGFGVGAKVVGNPIAAHLADRAGERRRPILLLILAATVAFALHAVVAGFWPLFAVSLAYFLIWPAVLPLTESLTLMAVRTGGLDYARIRLWGSVAFIVAAVGGGHVLAGSAPEVVFWMVLAASCAVCAAAWVLPDLRPAVGGRMRAPILHVLRLPGFALFLAAAAAVQASHAVYYGFATLHWRAVGYDDAVIGGLWALGVIAEILLFAVGDRVVRAVGPERLLVLGGLAGVLRWSVTGLTTEFWALLLMQPLHALTFGGAHLAAMHYIARAVPVERSASAQSLYSAAVMGLALGSMLLAAGPLYGALAGTAFLAMAIAAAVGATLALGLRRAPPETPAGPPSVG